MNWGMVVKRPMTNLTTGIIATASSTATMMATTLNPSAASARHSLPGTKRQTITIPTMGRMPKDMRGLMQQAAEMQKQLQKSQAELGEKTYVGTSGGGVVKATVKGTLELVSVEFDPSILDPDDPEIVGDLVVAAVNQATQAATDEAQAAMGGLTGGLDLGGLLG